MSLPGLAGEIGTYLWLGVLPGLAVSLLLGRALPAPARWTLGLAVSPLLSATGGALLEVLGVPLATGAWWIGALGLAGTLAGVVLARRGPAAAESGASRERAGAVEPTRAFRWWPLLAAALITLPAILNPWIRVRSDGWVHAAIVWEIAEHGVPPQDPRFAGLTLNYVWIFNCFIAQLTSLGGGDPFTFMTLFNGVNMAVFLRLVWLIAATVWRGSAAADGALLLAAVGFNAGAWLLFPLRLARALGGWERGWPEVRRQLAGHHLGTVDIVFTMAAPFAQMASMLDKFMLGTALNYAWLLLALFLWALARWVEEGARDALAWGAVASAGMLFVHGVVGMSALPVAVAALALAGLLALKLDWLPRLGRLAAFAAAIAAGVAIAAPYTWAISRGWAPGKSGLQHSYFGLGVVMPWTVLTSCGVALWLARRPVADAFRGRRPGATLLVLFAAAMIAFSIAVRLPSGNENKFPFQCFVPLAVLGGAAFLPAARALLARRGAIAGGVALLALFVVPPALTLGSYIVDRGSDGYPEWPPGPAERALHTWIRAGTGREAVFVDDRFRDVLAVEARRRLYLGSPWGPELAGFPRDQLTERRAVIADLYGPGAALERDARALRALGAPAYVLYRHDAARPLPASLRPDLFAPAYDREGCVVYRVTDP